MMRAVSNVAYSGGGTGLKAVGVVSQGAEGWSVTGTATKTALVTITVPALSPNSRLRVRALFDTPVNNANAKTASCELNGTVIGTSGGLASELSAVFDLDLFNRNATNVQIDRQAWSGPTGVSTGAFSIYAFDTSVPTTLTLSAQLAVTTDTVTLEAYSIELLNP